MTRRGYAARVSCNWQYYLTRLRRDEPLPCLEVAEFLGDNLADVDAEPIDDPLGEIRMRGPAEDLDIRHSALQATHT